MMKLTVAFLASLAAVDAAQGHGRRHVRRPNVDYGNGYGYGSPSHHLPGTGSSASSTAALPASSGLPEGGEGSHNPPYLGTGTAPSIATETPAAEFPPTFDTSSTEVPLTTAPAYGTGYPNAGSPTGISSSPLALSPSGNSTTTAVPTYSSASAGTIVTETSVSEVTHTVTETLTYTVGRGKNAHQTTTEIVSTSTETIYQTVTVTKDNEYPAPTSSAGKEDEITGTTTVKTTSTTYKYITVHPTGAAPTGEQGASPSKSGSQGEGADCQPPVTVTVTAQETVTVTVGNDTPSQETSPPEEGEVTSTTHITTTLYVTASPVEQPSQGPAHPTGQPAPYFPIPNNGTHPSGGAAGPTGFLTSKKPAPTPGYGNGYGTGEVPVPTASATSSLPADSLLPSSLPVVGEETAVPTAGEKEPKPTGAYGGEKETKTTETYAVPTEGYAAPTEAYGAGYKKRWGMY